MKKVLLFLALLLPIGAWAQEETVIAEKNWSVPLFLNDGIEGTAHEITSEGLAITKSSSSSRDIHASDRGIAGLSY